MVFLPAFCNRKLVSTVYSKKINVVIFELRPFLLVYVRERPRTKPIRVTVFTTAVFKYLNVFKIFWGALVEEYEKKTSLCHSTR